MKSCPQCLVLQMIQVFLNIVLQISHGIPYCEMYLCIIALAQQGKVESASFGPSLYCWDRWAEWAFQNVPGTLDTPPSKISPTAAFSFPETVLYPEYFTRSYWNGEMYPWEGPSRPRGGLDSTERSQIFEDSYLKKSEKKNLLTNQTEKTCQRLESN